MSSDKNEPVRDRWAQWFLHRRHGGDPEQHKKVMEDLVPVRERVLENAGIAEGDVLLEIGAGDGLIAFGAFEKIGNRGKVIFNEISQDLLDHCRSVASEIGVLDRTDFHLGRAENLDGIDDASVDVVTVRSVLIYISEKQKALDSFYRVLKPGGRLSIFEPINRFTEERRKNKIWFYDVSPLPDILEKFRPPSQPQETTRKDPMLDFDEQDLLALVEKAGFQNVHLSYEAHVKSATDPMPLETFLKRAPNPNALSLEEIMEMILTKEETQRLTNHLRPLVEEGRGSEALAVAYLWGVKGV